MQDQLETRIGMGVGAAWRPVRGEQRTVSNAWLAWRNWWKGECGGRAFHALARDEVLRLPGGGEGISVRVEAGMVIVTREGDPEDHVLQAGQEFRLPGRGLALAWAQEPSRIEVVSCAERADRRPVVRALTVVR